MNPYFYEETARQRIEELQLEMGNRRLMATGQPRAGIGALARLGARVWLLVGLRARGPARRLSADCECCSEVA